VAEWQMRDFLFGSARLNSISGDFGLLVLRLFAGLSLALAHGLGKLPPQPGFVQGVVAMGLPAWMAWLSGFAETFGGIALAAGFMTRAAALAIAINLSVAGFVRHAADPYLRKELAFLFLAVAVMYLLVGGGRFALDRLIKK
jgi:putative oxidoreductase